jgi:hypothetical protein
MRPQLEHTAGITNWPPFTAAELPPGLAGELEGILMPLYVATLALRRTVYRYELVAALGGNQTFVSKINGTTAAPALNTVKGCVYTAIVVSLCAFFDEEPGAVNLRAILNRVVRPDYIDSFRDFHNTTNPTFDTDRQHEHLLRLGIGLGFWITIPNIEREGHRFRLLAAIVVLGGIGRLWSLLTVGVPDHPMLFGLIMELAITPLLAFWQYRLAKGMS